MQVHLTNSTATYGSGIGPGQRIFKIRSGPYTGRTLILVQTSSSEISLTYADYPYLQWSSPAIIVNDSADYHFDAVMDKDSNIFIAYTLGSNSSLVCRMLTFSQGVWSVGSLNTIYNSDANHYPSIVQQTSGRLWVSWSRLSGGSYYVNCKSSDDNGVTWGSGPSGFGFEISSAASSAWSKMIMYGFYIYVIYTTAGEQISFRYKHIDAADFESEADIASGSGFDENFDAAISGDSRLGVVFENGQVRYREFNGSSWGGIINIDSDGGEFPQLKFVENCPYVIYLADFNGDQRQIMYSRRPGSTFSSPAVLDNRKDIFGKVFCYNSVVASYSDLTTAAGSNTAGDVYHPDSSALLKEVADVFYLGKSDRFHYLKILLSTPGTGGDVSWQYFNGTEWISFTPSGGAYSLNLSDRELLLWDDYASIPENWQKNNVNGAQLFWIRIVVSGAYTTGPVGSQITPVSNINALILME